MAAAVPQPPWSPRRLLLRWLFLAGCVYLGVLLLLMFLENRLVYHPATAARDWWQPPPKSDIQDVELRSADGTLIHGWYCPHPSSPGAVLYFHGNAGNLSHRGHSIVKVRDILKSSVLIIDYPGYGKSGGNPSEKGCYLAADAAYAWLRDEKKFPGENILLFGASLGGGVAVDLAAREPTRALVLVKTFTSAPDVGAHFYPWLPVRWVMRNRFNNLEKIGKVRAPVFIAHGDIDEVVPFRLGKKLYEAANEPRAFFLLEGQDHNQRLGEDFFRALIPFLDQNAPL